MNKELLFESLRQSIEFMPGMVSIKDTDSTFLIMNQSAANLVGHSSGKKVEGITDHELKCDAAEYAEQFIQQDQNIITTKQPLQLLDIHRYANGEVKFLLTTKKPITLENQTIGTLCQCIELNDNLLSSLGKAIYSLDTAFLNEGGSSYSIQDNFPDINLTSQEEICLFYLMRGMTAPHIAAKLNISKRTAEFHINNIKQKLGCTSKSDVIDKAVSLGLINILPKRILQKEKALC